MKNYFLMMLCAVACVGSPAKSWAAINPNAQIVLVRVDCAAVDNCFNTTESLASWITNTRNPDFNSPLLVDIGPGEFGTYSCTNDGYITLRGTGVNTTRLSGGSSNGSGTVDINNCNEIQFQDLSIIGGATSVSAVQWSGGGKSTWININLEAPSGLVSYAWYEDSGCSGNDPKAVHFWFNSRIAGIPSDFSPSAAYLARCSESWFYSSDILLKMTKAGVNANAVEVSGTGDVRVFGSTIRTVVPAGSGGVDKTFSPKVINVRGTGVFHMHGGIITSDARFSTKTYDIIGINARQLGSNTPTVHVIDTAFNLIPPPTGGIGRRIAGNAASVVESPFLWQNSDTPPSTTSQNGSDIFVETDCASSGCQDTGTETHLLIYNDNCNTDGHWFDVVTGRCRGL